MRRAIHDDMRMRQFANGLRPLRHRLAKAQFVNIEIQMPGFRPKTGRTLRIGIDESDVEAAAIELTREVYGKSRLSDSSLALGQRNDRTHDLISASDDSETS